MGLLDNFGSKVGTYLGDKENLLNLASGFASMSGNPNTASIMAGIQGQKESLMKRRDAKAAQDLANTQTKNQINRTAKMMIAKGGKYAEIGNQLQNGSITFEQARDDYQTLSKFEMEQGVKKPSVTWSQLPITEVMKRGYDPSVPLQISSDGKITTINSGSGVNITNTNASPVPVDTGEDDLFKNLQSSFGKSIDELASTYPSARNGMNQVETLIQLGAVMDNEVNVPTWARSLIPEGISTSIDAYRSIAFGVAQSMRVKGSGPMTDKDFNILVSRAGSASMDSDARQVVQSGLREAAQRKLDMANAADEFRMNPTEENKKIYAEKVKEIKNRPLFSQEQRAYLESISPSKDPGNLTQNSKTYFDTLPKSRQTSFLLMTPKRQAEFSAAWLREQTTGK